MFIVTIIGGLAGGLIGGLNFGLDTGVAIMLLDFWIGGILEFFKK